LSEEREREFEANGLQVQETKWEAQDISQASSGLPGLSLQKIAFPGRKKKIQGTRVQEKELAALIARL